MNVSTPRSNLGNHVFGVAALAFGLITLAWHDYNDGHQLRYIVYAAATASHLEHLAATGLVARRARQSHFRIRSCPACRPIVIGGKRISRQ